VTQQRDGHACRVFIRGAGVTFAWDVGRRRDQPSACKGGIARASVMPVLTPDEHRPSSRWPLWTTFLGLTVLIAAGIVIALGGVLVVPGPIVGLALLVALVAAVTVAGATWAESRRRGIGWVRSIGRSLRALGRFVFDFF